MNLSYHPVAETEVVAVAKFYEQRVPGLGTQFLDEFEASIGKVLQTPAVWRSVKGDKRRYLMPRFPYGIYYRIAGDTVRILVVKHHSQHPDYGSNRA